MKNESSCQGVVVKQSYTIVEISHELNIPESLLEEMETFGLFSAAVLHEAAVERIKAACRLHRDLGINLPGVVLVLELRDQLAELDKQFKILQKSL